MKGPNAGMVWTRGWRKRDGTVHVEVRDPDLRLEFVESYPGKDHTLHIILREKKEGA
jgi:hypothetical protein